MVSYWRGYHGEYLICHLVLPTSIFLTSEDVFGIDIVCDLQVKMNGNMAKWNPFCLSNRDM